jgi:tRNA(Ile2) C34 agmatinyltransferase TiaS
MQKVSMVSEHSKHGNYVTMKVSKESRMVLSEIQNSDPLWRHIDVKDIIALAWPRCPACGGPLTVKLMSQNLICVKCKAEYQLTRVV